MTPEQLNEARAVELARHALGADSREPGYRNHFCASPGAPDDLDWAAMVERGLARQIGRPREGLPYNTYVVSDTFRATILQEHANG